MNISQPNSWKITVSSGAREGVKAATAQPTVGSQMQNYAAQTEKHIERTDTHAHKVLSHFQQKAVEAQVTALTESAEITRNSDGLDPAILKNTALIDN